MRLSNFCKARHIHAGRDGRVGETTGDSFPPHPLSLAFGTPDDDYNQMLDSNTESIIASGRKERKYV